MLDQEGKAGGLPGQDRPAGGFKLSLPGHFRVANGIVQLGGFRELAIGVLFALALPTIPASLVAIIALLSRAVSTAAELLCVGAAYLSGGKQIPQVQQEQTANQNPPTTEPASEENTPPPIEASTNVMAERGSLGE